MKPYPLLCMPEEQQYTLPWEVALEVLEYQKHRRYNNVPQQRVLRKQWKPCKLGGRTSGPYRVLQTHVNGTLTIELQPVISERLNIRMVIPHKEPTDT
jgi:hypothetical protein